eukprot:COSAG01_NODE_3318_length_6272_cov_2.193261_1_plen_94_part_00
MLGGAGGCVAVLRRFRPVCRNYHSRLCCRPSRAGQVHCLQPVLMRARGHVFLDVVHCRAVDCVLVVQRLDARVCDSTPSMCICVLLYTGFVSP